MTDYPRPHVVLPLNSGPKAKNRKRRSVGFWLLLMLILTIQLLVCAWCRIECRQAGYQISDQMNDYHKLLAIQRTLKIEAERLRSPERITRIAHNKLNLITPTQHQKRYIPIHETY